VQVLVKTIGVGEADLHGHPLVGDAAVKDGQQDVAFQHLLLVELEDLPCHFGGSDDLWIQGTLVPISLGKEDLEAESLNRGG
jgi:hypothetical protein